MLFVDYSGLQNFEPINRSFVQSINDIRRFTNLDSDVLKLQKFKDAAPFFAECQKLPLDVTHEHEFIVDEMFTILTSINVMIQNEELLKQCPTLYLVKMEFSRNVVDLKYQAAYDELTSVHQLVLADLMNSVKYLILSLKPTFLNEDSIETWSVLQKIVFGKNCKDITTIYLRNSILDSRMFDVSFRISFLRFTLAQPLYDLNFNDYDSIITSYDLKLTELTDPITFETETADITLNLDVSIDKHNPVISNQTPSVSLWDNLREQRKAGNTRPGFETTETMTGVSANFLFSPLDDLLNTELSSPSDEENEKRHKFYSSNATLPQTVIQKPPRRNIYAYKEKSQKKTTIKKHRLAFLGSSKIYGIPKTDKNHSSDKNVLNKFHVDSGIPSKFETELIKYELYDNLSSDVTWRKFFKLQSLKLKENIKYYKQAIRYCWEDFRQKT